VTGSAELVTGTPTSADDVNLHRRAPRLLLFAVLAASVLLAPLASTADTLPELIVKVRPSVLVIGFYRETQSPRFAFKGTGFVVGDGNLLVTNAHVVQDDGGDPNGRMLIVQSREADGALKARRGDIVEMDIAHDLALIRFDGPPIAALQFAKAGSVREGSAVALMGFPLAGALGFAPVTHRGIVSAITPVALPSPTARQLDGRTISRLREGSFNMLQLDATAYPGNSGGPLFDAETGAVVGVLNMTVLKGTRESALTSPSGISYAIPSEYVEPLVARHARH
jgi:S1-C subfamily serine protease